MLYWNLILLTVDPEITLYRQLVCGPDVAGSNPETSASGIPVSVARVLAAGQVPPDEDGSVVDEESADADESAVVSVDESEAAAEDEAGAAGVVRSDGVLDFVEPP